jgi:PAS domain S-box-containing protein
VSAATDHPPISLAHLPPTPSQSRAALAGTAALLVGLGALAPFAATEVPKVTAFMPAIDAIICLTDLITAGLLFAQFSITRSRAIWALACGYLFSAMIVIVHLLTYPGVFSPLGNIFGGHHTNFKIYLLWHVGLPLAVFAYAWLKHKDSTKGSGHTPTETVLTVGGVGLLALLGCIASLTLLPNVDPAEGRWLTAIVMFICAGALCVLWLLRRTALDQWLMLVMLAMIVELAITALIGGRGPHVQPLGMTFGIYTGRLFSLVTSTAVLIGLLTETSGLYSAVARADALTGIADACRALSGEIVLSKLIERLMKIAIENTGADRGVLILPSESVYLIYAEARAAGDRIEVTMPPQPMPLIGCPQSLVRHVIRARELVVLDDAHEPNQFSADEYLREGRSRSVLCVPLVNQAQLTGVLLLENRSSAHAFTPSRVAVLELMTAQAAVSLENASLYSELHLLAGLLQRLPVSAWTLKSDGTPDFVNQVWLDYSGQTLDFVRSHPEAWMTAVHPEDREAASRAFWDGVRSGRGFAIETRSLRARDGVYRWHLQQAVVLRDADGKAVKFVGTTTDVDDQRRAEEALRQAQRDLARINRVTTMGELAGSLAHELSQPISGAITNADTCLRKLGHDEPDLDGVRVAVARIARDARRAAEIILRIRSQFEKGSPKPEAIDVNEIISETIALLRDEAMRYGIAVRTQLAADLPQIVGDRIQLQQVAMNLIFNSIEAMREVHGMREIVMQSTRTEGERIHVSFADTGPGLPPHLAQRVFEPFFTTKAHGTGMGLRISKSIVEAHGGHLWAESAAGRGAVFHVSLPVSTPRMTMPGELGTNPRDALTRD